MDTATPWKFTEPTPPKGKSPVADRRWRRLRFIASNTPLAAYTG
jgi:hypothetical protein